jgi:hypothetical protein
MFTDLYGDKAGVCLSKKVESALLYDRSCAKTG